ncbi:MAG: methyl-accepting chemotaxis protein [Desulfuromonadaceae bacterium]|nr:methyl-accepting chemotaxis protein [Desulfuromonadaceae bacterium]
MKIKSKLVLNSVTILMLMVVIAVAAVIGIRFIQLNIFKLTQKSTPYQIKTFNHQRVLQAHTSNLLKVAASDSLEAFKLNAVKSTESLGDEIKAADELTALGSSSDYEHGKFTDITKSIEAITAKRLVLQKESLAAVSAMKGSLANATQKLQALDGSVRKLQKGATDKMVSSIYNNAIGNEQMTIVAEVTDGLKDIASYCRQVLLVSSKETQESMYANISIPLSKLQGVRRINWTEKRENENFVKRLETISDKLSAARDEQVKFLNTKDAGARAAAAKLVNEAEKEVAYLLTCTRAEAEKSTVGQMTSSEVMTNSVGAFSATNTVLILSSETLLSSAVIDSLINYSLSVKNLTEFDKAVNTIRTEFVKVDTNAKKLKGLLQKGNFKNETRLLGESVAALSAVRVSFLDKGGAADKIRASLKNVEDVATLNQQVKGMVAAQMELSSRDVAVAQQSQEGTVKAVKAAVTTTTTLIIVIAVLAVLASLILGRWTAVSITRPIDELSRVAAGFGAGDFSIRMDENRKDEFGRVAEHFNQATAKLAEIAKLLKDAIDKLAAGSVRLKSTADYLFKGAQEQVTQTAQSSVAMAEISATVQTVAGHAHDSAASSKEAHVMATTGKAVVTEAVRGMHEISEAVRTAAGSIAKLSENSKTIDSILSVIDDIADQTNLLALNAAIEAARAGEQGMGFAVVADEVRKLAQRTAEATHEIAGIIHVIRVDTESSVSAMNDGKTKVEEGMKLSGEASKSLDAIVGVSEHGVGMAQLIATATDDQSTASREVSQSMELIANISGSLKDSTVEIKDASRELSEIAGELNSMVAWFKVAA